MCMRACDFSAGLSGEGPRENLVGQARETWPLRRHCLLRRRLDLDHLPCPSWGDHRNGKLPPCVRRPLDHEPQRIVLEPQRISFVQICFLRGFVGQGRGTVALGVHFSFLSIHTVLDGAGGGGVCW